MNRFFTILIVFLAPVFLFAQSNSDELLDKLDQTVADYAIVFDKKEVQINKLKELLPSTSPIFKNMMFMESCMRNINRINRIQH